jgi:hypothetical protein
MSKRHRIAPTGGMSQVVRIEAGERGLSWLRYSLESGLKISHAVLHADLHEGTCWVFVPDKSATPALDNPKWGGVTTKAATNAALDKLIAQLRADLILVEEELHSPGDRGLQDRSDYFVVPPDEIVSWAELAHWKRIGEFFRFRTAGYPTNVFLVAGKGERLLERISESPEGIPDWVVQSLVAVIVSIFDDESWLVWLRAQDQLSLQ